MLRQRLQSFKSAHRQTNSPLRLHSAALRADISVVSVAYMGGEQLQNWLRGWRDRKVQAPLPSLIASRIKPTSASFQQAAKPLSQPSSLIHSPRASLKVQGEASPVPSASTDDRSPLCSYSLPLKAHFPVEVSVWSERKPKASQDPETSFRRMHYPLNISASRDNSGNCSFAVRTTDPSPEPLPPITRREVGRSHLHTSFPREVFGGRPGRRRTKRSN